MNMILQVTKDEIPIIFHDNYILTEEAGTILEKQVTDLYLEEFLSYGPQRDSGKVGKSMLRKTKDGRVFTWMVEVDDSLCTLQEAFQSVESHLGFNIELKFDDHVVYGEEELTRALNAVLRVVFEHANERPIIFSSFQPDATQLMRKLQSIYPVFFLTNGGTEIFSDVRRNSVDEAINLCLVSGLQGVVSEVKGIFKDPSAVSRVKESSLSLLTYGKLNNVPEAVYMQHLMGIDGVIVDLVEEITVAVSVFIRPVLSNGVNQSSMQDEEEEEKVVIVEYNRPRFSERELSFLFRLIPELVEP
ncbi:glycerophosphodiester phosphodiesterase GDPD2-like isoform X2 [Asparagus officinalis]|uniref:glycerophosphodiester phosphodiesterase GDPD2-like isoform X2 n=1 Tax=Asparagus officinalis TaxID=4686 RepID=UPI00098E6A54|nr:glycerophosphodiester phosphodiesterase GDPD2-like isoform X2 [Asparagus officinalis]